MLNNDKNEKFLSLFQKLSKIIYKDANFLAINNKLHYDCKIIQDQIVDLKGSIMELFALIE
jgi:hypothetical protein